MAGGDVLDRVIGLAPCASSAAASESSDAFPEFVPSPSWSGSRSGYYFGTSDRHGTGYHLDHDAPGGSAAPNGATAGGTKRSVRFSSAGGDGDETEEVPGGGGGGKKRRRPDAGRRKTGEELLAEAESALRDQETSAPFGGAGRVLDLTPPRRPVGGDGPGPGRREESGDAGPIPRRAGEVHGERGGPPRRGRGVEGRGG